MFLSYHSKLLLILLFTVVCPVLSVFVLDDFEKNGVDNWKTLTLSSDIKHSGSYSGCWLNTSKPTSVSFDITKVKSDWSAYTLFSIWIYSSRIDNSGFQLVVSSENASSTGDDYYSFAFTLDWQGWKQFQRVIPSGFGKSRNPLGWDKLSGFRIYASGWGHTPSGTKICFDDMTLDMVPPLFVEQVNLSAALVPGFDTRFSVPIKGLEQNNKPATLVATISKGSSYVKSATWEDTSKSITESRAINLKNNELLFLIVNLKASDAAASGSSRGKDIQIDFCMVVSGGTDQHCWSFTGKVNPNPASGIKDHPYMLFTKAEIAKYKSERKQKPWVDSQLTVFENNIKYLDYDYRFPDGVSRWTGYYCCADGTSLKFDESSPYSHYCPSDKKYYTGEPYNGGWITTKHGKNIGNAYNLALNYLMNNNATVLNKIKEVLIDYSKKYLTSPYHGTDGSDNYFAVSGGRLQPQTLDESSLAINIAKTYDIVFNGLTREERSYIEYNLLRPLYVTIKRQNSKESNWQSWHNAGMVGIGVVLNDNDMITYATDGPTNGFKFQMEESVGDDGIWYEQSMGYHYYALNALQTHAEFAKVAGYDLFNYAAPMKTVPGGKKSLKDMYMGPIHLMMPNLAVPGINDGSEESLVSNVNYYELAYAEYPEEKEIIGWALCTFLANSTRRSIYALKYGEVLPDWCSPTGPIADVKNPLKTEFMQASGSAILRTEGNYLFYENGPHGGWHGHYDKLGIVFYAHGKELVKDYGSLPYRLPMHNNYFKRTLSHSALMLDGVCQTESQGTGPAVVDGSLGDVQISKLTTNVLNDGNLLRRSFIFIDDEDDDNSEYPIVLDISEAIIANESSGTNHFFDLITHSETTQYSLVDSNGVDVNVKAVTESMGSDVAWQYLTSLKRTESKKAMTGVWNWGHTVRHQFDNLNEWTGMELSKDHVKIGQYSMRWKDHTVTTGTSTKKYMNNWTEVDRITLTLYNVVQNTEKLYLIIYSENATSPLTDYYYYVMPLDWTGWKTFNWTKTDFKISRSPMGWDSITGLSFSAAWGHTELSSSDVYFDSMRFWRKDGTEIDGLGGLEQLLPEVNYDRKTFYDLNAPSIPTSKSHAVSIIRQNAKNPIVQLLRPYTESKFVLSFSKVGDSYSILTAAESITITPGDSASVAPCAKVTRASNKIGTINSYLGCKAVVLTESKPNITLSLFPKEGSVISFQTANSTPVYDAESETVVFNNVKVPGGKVIGINVSSCSGFDGFTVFVNGMKANVTGRYNIDIDSCVLMEFSIKVNPSVMGNITVLLKDTSLSSASHIQHSIIIILTLLLFSLFI